MLIDFCIQMNRGDGAALSHRVLLEIKTGKMYRKQGSLEHRAQVPYYFLHKPLVLVAFVLANVAPLSNQT